MAGAHCVHDDRGKRWSRVHVVEHPLSEYVRYEMLGYVESAAASEAIFIADRTAQPDLAALRSDFWLFDAEGDSCAVLMHYSENGEVLGFEYSDDPDVLAECRAQRDLALDHAVALNVYLAEMATMRAG